MTTGKLEFSRKTHVYRVDGRVIPSVTQILGVIPSPEAPFAHLPVYQERGQGVHKACENCDLGKRYDPAYKEWVGNWNRFKLAHRILKFDRRDIEVIHYNPLWYYGGTVDRISHKRKWIIDIKSGVKNYKDLIQLHAYRDMLLRLGIVDESYKLVRAYIREDGWKIWIDNYDSKIFNEFLNCLTVYNLQFKKGRQ